MITLFLFFPFPQCHFSKAMCASKDIAGNRSTKARYCKTTYCRQLKNRQFKFNQMRNLIYAINLTIDGCCDHTQVGPPHHELFDYSIRLVQDTDAFVYRRKTY